MCPALALAAFACFQADTQLEAAAKAERAGDFASAEHVYERLLTVRPSAEIWQRLGLVRHMQNKFHEAIPAFEQAIREDSKLWGAHLFLGIDYYRINQFSRALNSLEQARSLTNHPEVEFWLGATHLALKHYLPGLRILEKLLERDPKNREVLRLLAENYAEFNSTLWNHVAERRPDTAAGYEVHARALEFEGSTGAALEAYREALNIDPKRPGIRVNIGRLLLGMGKIAEGLAEFELELRQFPGEPEASYQAGVALVKAGRFDEARKYLEQAMRWPQTAEEARMALQSISSAKP